MGILLDGREVAKQLESLLAAEIREAAKKTRVTPCLASVLVGDNPESEAYVARKVTCATQIGICAEVYRITENVTTEGLRAHLNLLSARHEIHGILLQLPLPAHIDTHRAIDCITPEKDVDGLGLHQQTLLLRGMPGLRPCTPQGICALLDAYGIRTRGKHAVIVGRGELVGRPLSHMLASAPYHMSVTITHSYSADLGALTREAHVLVAAAGSPYLIKESMVQEGAVVIDAGTTMMFAEFTKKGYAIVGDVDFKQVEPNSSYITPSPGGVGPMTVYSLLCNTFKAYTHQLGL